MRVCILRHMSVLLSVFHVDVCSFHFHVMFICLYNLNECIYYICMHVSSIILHIFIQRRKICHNVGVVAPGVQDLGCYGYITMWLWLGAKK